MSELNDSLEEKQEAEARLFRAIQMLPGVGSIGYEDFRRIILPLVHVRTAKEMRHRLLKKK